MNWAEIPKTELHLHLEGAAPPEFIRTLAEEQGIQLEGVFDAAGEYQWNGFAEFLECYIRATTVLTTPDHFRRLVEAVLKRSASQGIIYTEMFVAPDLAGGADPVAWQEHLAAMEAGADAVPQIETRFIVTSIRNLGPEAVIKAAHLAAEYPSRRLTGFGMSGEERHMRAADFVRAFDIAREAGLGLTSHAGEMVGPESITETLDHLKVSRIGHGVRAVEDANVMDRLSTEGIVLEVNPGSNVAIGIVPDLASHPVTRLRDAGIRVTISTDDPPYFHTNLSIEYEGLARHHGWSTEDFATANRTAMQAAFCDAETRSSILTRLANV